jgi:uncharacterized protein YecT (DUF1311 family)
VIYTYQIITRLLKLALALFLIINSNPTVAQLNEIERDSLIKTASLDALINNYETLGLQQSLSLVSNEADRRLNYFYNEIMNRSGISDSSKNILRISQRNWIKFRDLEFQYISSQFKGLSGSMYPKITLIQQIKVVAHRVEELERYNKLLLTRE